MVPVSGAAAMYTAASVAFGFMREIAALDAQIVNNLTRRRNGRSATQPKQVFGLQLTFGG